MVGKGVAEMVKPEVFDYLKNVMTINIAPKINIASPTHRAIISSLSSGVFPLSPISGSALKIREWLFSLNHSGDKLSSALW